MASRYRHLLFSGVTMREMRRLRKPTKHSPRNGRGEFPADLGPQASDLTLPLRSVSRFVGLMDQLFFSGILAVGFWWILAAEHAARISLALAPQTLFWGPGRHFIVSLGAIGRVAIRHITASLTNCHCGHGQVPVRAHNAFLYVLSEPTRLSTTGGVN